MSPNATHTSRDPLSRLANVKTDTLIPIQQPTPQTLLTSVDCYEQRFVKYPEIAVCHTRAEYIFALMLESDPEVISFVPQPFHLQVKGRKYIPDFYVLRKQERQVIEVKGTEGMNEGFRLAVSEFFDWHDLTFSVVSNESVLAHETRALNWLPLVQALSNANSIGIDTTALEYQIYQRILEGSATHVGDLLQASRREEQYLEETALYRLIHQHRIIVNVDKTLLDFDAEVRIWESPGDSD